MSQQFKNDSLGTRMKGYETTTQNVLLRRTPVIIRVDGKAFHTFTKKINHFNDVSMVIGPFSQKLHNAMTHTMLAMVSQIQNATFGYTQSDEISILLTDWTTLTTDQWFGANIQKITSISGAMAATYFNFFLKQEFNNDVFPTCIPACIPDIPLFDARVFNIPKEEVTNYFIWREGDATRNSINMLGQHHFSHKELQGKNLSQVQDMLMRLQLPINWNNLDSWKKRGVCVIPNLNKYSSISPYIIDENIPIFTQDRNYIEKLLLVEEV